MNGKAAQLERWLEAIRQRALTNSLGQVTCRGIGAGHSRGTDLGLDCAFCGAAV